MCSIPAQNDGVFVRVRAGASDTRGTASLSGELTYRVLNEGIDDIADIQQTFDGVSGDSPFAGATWDMENNRHNNEPA